MTEEVQEEEQETEGRVDVLDDKGRQVKRSARLQGQQLVQVDVNHDEAVVFTRLMEHHNLLTSRQEQGRSSKGFNGFNRGYSKAVKAISFIETFSLKRGIAKFGEPGREAAKAEMKQLHERTAFTPLHPEEMTPAERRKTLESLIFLVQKRDGRIKARTVANGSVQRGWMTKEEAASPTAAVESILLTAVIDAAEERCVATVDIPHAFIQTDIKDDKDGDRITMKMRGPIVDMLVELDYNLYHDKVVHEKNDKVLYVHVKKAIYGMIQSSLMFYKKLRADLESEGFKINPYDPCIANKMVNGKQMTIAWHVDDLKVSHKHEKEVDKFIAWLESKYGSDTGRVKAVKGNRHDYLGMILDFSKRGKVMVDMTGYVKKMLEEFPETIKDNVTTPASDKVFDVDESPKLEQKRAELLHMFVAKALFIAKRGRPDIQVPVAFLCTRVQEPTEQDWYKLIRMMKFLKRTKGDVLTLSAQDLSVTKWYADAAFAVHPDMRSHTGYTMSMGEGAIISSSRKQKLNTRSSTEAELVACDDAMTQVLWTRNFLKEQGYETKTYMKQDNTSAIQLEKNGKASSHKRTRHINIRYFFIKDQIDKGIVQVEHCPTDQMDADYMSKATQGETFKSLRAKIMGLEE